MKLYVKKYIICKFEQNLLVLLIGISLKIFTMKDNKKQNGKEKKLSRRAAMTRLGLSALSATTMMMLLNKPAKGQWDDSPDIPPDWP